MIRTRYCGWRTRSLKVSPVFCRSLAVCERDVVGLIEDEGPRSTRYLARDRLVGAGAIFVSLGLHALALWPGNFITLEGSMGASGPRPVPPSDPIEVVNLPERPAPAPPEEVPDPQAVAPIQIAMPQARLSRAGASPAVRGERVAGVPGAGVVMLRGTGIGLGSSHEVEDTFVSPRARSILPTWRAPPMAQGYAVLVQVHTNAQGFPTGPVKLVNPTPHTRTNRTILEQVLYLEYWPARRDGLPVAAWAEILYVFCHHGTTATSPPGIDIDRDKPCSQQADPDGDPQ